MEKAKLTREQAHTLERAKETAYLGENLHSLVMAQATRKYPDLKFNILLDLDMDTFCRALYVGYEIIEEDQAVVVTAEMGEALLKAIRYPMDKSLKQWDEGFKAGAKTVLEQFGINIKGITERES